MKYNPKNPQNKMEWKEHTVDWNNENRHMTAIKDTKKLLSELNTKMIKEIFSNLKLKLISEKYWRTASKHMTEPTPTPETIGEALIAAFPNEK